MIPDSSWLWMVFPAPPWQAGRPSSKGVWATWAQGLNPKPMPHMKTHSRSFAPWPRLAGLTLGTALAAIAPASAQSYFQAPYGPGGTWRIYEINPTATLTFKDAVEEARAKTDPVNNTVTGNLFSLTSAAKELFIRRNLNRQGGDVWIGLTDREGVLPLGEGGEDAQESITFGTAGDAHRLNGWKFLNGDSYGDYVNWGAGEPNNAGNIEDAVHFNTGGWNDHRSGYEENEPIFPELQPGTSQAESADAPLFRSIIEYSTDSPTPFPGIRHGAVIPPSATFNLPPHTDGNWSVRVVRDLAATGNIVDSVDQALLGEGTLVEELAPYIDFTDPDTNAAGGPILTTDPLPFPGDQPGDDDNIILVAKTRLSVATAGTYTIQVRSDDGFALRIPGQTWSEVAGAGYIDPLDPATLVFETGTGDSNTRGVITLAAGAYDVEFVNWEGAVGSYVEVTSATGTRLNAGEAQWLPLGSTATLPEINTVNAVHLKEPAAVANANFGRATGRQNNLPALRKLMEYAIDNGQATEDVREVLEIAEADMPGYPGTDWEYYLTKITGSFTLEADADGNGTGNELIDVTFGLFSDDGSSLRIIGEDFLAVNDFVAETATLVDNGGDMTLTADYPSGNTNAYGHIRLREGQSYQFEAYMYELEVGSNFNLRWQLGNQLAGGFTGGQTPLRTADYGDVLSLDEPATVINTDIPVITVPFMDLAIDMVNETVAQNVATTGAAPVLILRDSADGGSITGASYAGINSVFPVGGADYYLTKVTGTLVVDNQNGTAGESLTLTFGMFSDDGSAFRIVGQDFTFAGDAGTNADAGSPGAVLGDIGGDQAMVADLLTGNADALGVITLAEGEYAFEGYHFENAGGSGYEIWWAVGEHEAFDPTLFRPLSNNPGLFVPGNTGIPLVAAGVTPPTESFAITNFQFNATTGEFTLTFDSVADASYALDYTIGFLPAGEPPAASRWNVAPGFATVPATGASTTITGAISALVTPDGTLPDGSQSFFRVRRL